MLVAAFNRADMVEWLLAHGASLDARDWSGLRALDIARAMHADASVAVLDQAGSGAH
ncbi:MAG: hypothetical protein GEV06_26635 [Luteitalea sp.]|nr:hypothetical protein [Luteitalea sp.]